MTPTEALSGGREERLPLPNGAHEVVLVREVPVLGNGYQRYARALQAQDLNAELELYGITAEMQKRLGWANLRRLRQIGREVNADPFEMATEDANPVMAEARRELRTLKQTLRGMATQATSPSDSSTPAGPGT